MIIKGDVNGDGKITQEDLILLQLGLYGGEELIGDSSIAADANGDGILTSADADAIYLHLYGQKIINEVIK